MVTRPESGANAVLSGFFYSLDFFSTFDQAKVERKIKRLNGVELQIPPSEGIRCHAELSACTEPWFH